jgi:energy-coupling factor transporter transmembrane protein EcfT
MENFILILLCLVVVALLAGLYLGLPIGAFIFSYRWLSRKGYQKVGLLVSVLAIGMLAYFVYFAIYPDDDFYKNDFEHYTDMPFPDSGKIINKDASFPDTHGKYASCALIKFSEADYGTLLLEISTDTTFKADHNLGYSGMFSQVAKGVNRNDTVKVVRKKKLNIAFLNDKKTVIVEHTIF